jgi:hypothetical protein
MSGWKSWSVGEVVEAGDFQDLVQDQVVQTYADAATRTSTLGTAVTEGMMAFTADDDNLAVYANNNWNTVSQAISPNYIINGAFDIWQRGTSFSVGTTSQYTADRFYYFASGATASVTQQSFTPADLNAVAFGDATNFLRLSVSTGNNNGGVSNRIEDVRTLAGQTVTFSFWAKGTNPAGGELQVQFIQSFGSGGSAANTQFADTISLTSSWQRFSRTITLDSISGKTIGAGSLLWVLLQQPSGDTSTDAWEIDTWGWQIEAGSVATPFRRNANSLQGELAACQRYYQKYDTPQNHTNSTGYLESTTTARTSFPLSVPMRAAPTFTITGTFGIVSNGTLYTVTYLNADFVENGAFIRQTWNGTGLPQAHACALRHNGTAEFSAEL